MDIRSYDLESKELKKLNNKPLSNNQLLLGVYKDRLLWTTEDLSIDYSTTFDYKDINYDIDSIFTDENAGKDTYIEFEYNGPGTQTCTLYKINGDKKEEICKNVSFFMKYADYSIYEVAIEPVLIGEDANDHERHYYQYTDNKLYYINNDGTDNKMLCDLLNIIIPSWRSKRIMTIITEIISLLF